MSFRDRLAQVPGVAEVAWATYFAGVYIDQRHYFSQFPVDPQHYLEVYPEYRVAPEEKEAFRRERTACIVGEKLAKRYGFKPGDQITIYSNNVPFRYEITMRKILPERGQPNDVRRANARWIQPTEDERITLITCWPYTSNTHRLIIVAKPLPPERTNAPIEP